MAALRGARSSPIQLICLVAALRAPCPRPARDDFFTAFDMSGTSVPPAILLMGPTASGKSALALALAARFPVEIVSVDSAQVYRGMDIGTAKPDAATRARVRHHLVDILDPTDAYSAARFRTDTLAAVAAIRGRGRIPLLVGGTMLY